jgi:hypothetical protein
MRALPALALSASLLIGGCQHPDGTTDWGSTAALGIGAAALVGLAVAASNSQDDGYRHYQRRPYDRRGDWRRYGGYQDRRYNRTYW